ncbi:hypothetical protein HPG69_015663 [Diceros bicornis minor]|uniref:Uncharacterized protein n=1 Tax=Diceros bicornis minor TaxID=77932 RepID=A0A7J7E8G4_DICBM|nr:hypothetical protein HPG69_015663 [Diceros bicornis minor]
MIKSGHQCSGLRVFLGSMLTGGYPMHGWSEVQAVGKKHWQLTSSSKSYSPGHYKPLMASPITTKEALSLRFFQSTFLSDVKVTSVKKEQKMMQHTDQLGGAKLCEKHDLHITPQQGCGEPILQGLACFVEEAMEQPLSGNGMQNGITGTKNGPEEEFDLEKLNDLEKSVENRADQLEGLIKSSWFSGIFWPRICNRHEIKGIYWADKILGLTHIKLNHNKSSLLDAGRTKMRNQHSFEIFKIKDGLINLNLWQTDLRLPANIFGMVNE